MTDHKFSYTPKYSNSRALIVGINNYKSASPLSYAVSDAEEIYSLLKTQFDFKEDSMTLLLDEEATKDNIMKAFLSYTSDDVNDDERIFVFFAGHGHTRSGKRGEVGYLVPHDANMDDFSTFIRWDDLTRNTDLIPAKHMFFIMDACYGGLAITRSLKPGSVRFLKDMLLRYSRQVLTAGKADEIVADSGGPIPNHSVFTGHLIEALNGNAANEQGVITANAVMAYVYEKVSTDSNSNQTPHYGFFDGDGDFIFKAPGIDGLTHDEQKDTDEMLVIPSVLQVSEKRDNENKIEKVKRLIASESTVIELHDYVVQEIRNFLSASSEDNFKTQGVQFSKEELLERMSSYESLIKDIAGITASLAYWAKPAHKQILQKIIARSTDRLESQSGLIVWIYLRWYPIIIQTYSAGIASVAGQRYDSLSDVFYMPIGVSDYNDKQELFVDSLGKSILELNRTDVFKQIPGHEKHYVPLSEYLYKLLQPELDDILFIGKGYEQVFDEFEVMFGLAVADIRKQNDRHVWGPIGRFGWKQHNRDNAPLNRIIDTAKRTGKSWMPLQQGMFGGDYDRFILVAEEYQKAINGLNWW